ncbi:hypothetical protein MHUMG1_10239 [Metarhizium humberi]|uniref:Quercetin 2,3-dioxygenase n=1 Tax=Metarhizium humberi TaxID=2596975 RepID=A0A9P8M1M3_9HYPO|nr:hypothetical protein MHUMG1_10239 [Metarhizium humberi]
MGFTQALVLALAAATIEGACAPGSGGAAASPQNMVVSQAPDFVRPYVLPKYRGRSIMLSQAEVLRFAITTNSSGGAFSMIQHNGQFNNNVSARYHDHHNVHEHLYCARGRVQFWAQKNTSEGEQEARQATPGDYASLPTGTIHTFQLVDPDAQLTHVFHPAGFEHLFDVFYGEGKYDSSTSAPYLATAFDESPFAGTLSPEAIASLNSLDLYLHDNFVPRRDFVNGTAGDSRLNWHDGPNELPTKYGEPYAIAKDYGPKFLNAENGYKIVQPFADKNTEKDFTMGTVILSPKLDNETVTTTTLPHHFALQMEDGHLILAVDGYESVALLHGDVAFIPAGTKFSYHADVPYTKFMYMNNGTEGLDHQLMQKAVPWGWPTYPHYAGYKA